MRRIFRNLFATKPNRTNIIRRSQLPNRTRLSLLNMEDRVVPALIAVTSNADSGAGSFRDAVVLANSNADNDTIDFQFAANTTITLLTQVTVTEDTGLVGATVAITSSGAGKVTLDGNKATGLLVVDGAVGTAYTGATFKVSDLTFTNGKTAGDGGAFLGNSTVTLTTFTNVTITNNEADGSFGGGAAFSGDTILINCTITGNVVASTSAATVYGVGGGGIFSGGTNLTLSGCTVTGNKVTGTLGSVYGGGVEQNSVAVGGLTITNSNISGNMVSTAGAGKTAWGGNIVAGDALTLTNSTVSSGVATAGIGSGLVSFAGPMNLTGSSISGNTNAATGGGIYSQASSITITNCQINSNSASGNGGALRFGAAVGVSFSVSDSTFDGNTGTSAGGTIWRSTVNATDTITFNRCTFSNNTSGNSGGVFASNGAGSGTVAFINSTFFNNQSAANGSIIRTFGTFAGKIDVRNCTVVGNVAPGAGAINVGGAAGTILNVESSVFFNNKSAGTTKNANADLVKLTTTTANVDHSYVSVGFPAGFTATGTANILGTAAAPIDPQLEATLTNHGGTTKTLLPLSGTSPVVNKGSNPSGLTTDQRNDPVTFPRTFGGTADIGAVEFNNPVPTVTAVSVADVTSAGATIHTFTITFTSTVNQINASTLSAIGAVTVSGGGFGSPVNATLVGTYTDAPSITATFSIVPPGGSWDFADNGTYTISIGANKVFDKTGVPLPVPAGAVATFKSAIGASIVVNATNDEAVDSDTLTSLREAINLSNTVAYSGKDTITFDATVFAGTQTITLDSVLKTLTISDSLVINGPAGHVVLDAISAGARIMAIAGTGTLSVLFDKIDYTNGLAADLAFGSNGGAVRIADENVSFTNCVFTANTNALEGGAVGQNGFGNLSFTNCTFRGNKTTNSGGGAIGMVGGGTLTVTNTTIEGNTSAGGGGAIFATNLNNLTITGSKIGTAGLGNTAAGNGGAVNATGAIAMSVTNSSFVENSSTGVGIVAAGAIFLNGTTNLTITGSSFIGNNGSDAGTGSVAGALGILGNATVSIDTSTFKGNFTASGDGGAIWTRNDSVPTITITNSTISGNTAGGAVTTGSGGGIMLGGGGTLTITNSTVAGNSAATDGGGIDARGNSTAAVPTSAVVAIRNSTIAFNNASAGTVGGGGIALHTIGAAGSLTLSSTIVAKNVNAVSADINADAAKVATSTNNFIGDTTGSVVTYSNPILSGDPLFAVAGLVNNGGPTETIAIQSTSPAKNTGNNSLSLANDQRGATFLRNSGLGTDIGAFEFQDVSPPAKVSKVAINSTLSGVEAIQRSRVIDVAITFDSPVSFVGSAAAAFTLDKVGGGSVTLAAVVSGGGTVVTLTFTGGNVDANSLADGRYALHALASQFAGAGLDGNGNGIAQGSPTDDFIFDEAAAPGALDLAKIFRIFGDNSGDGAVATNDFIQFRLAFGGSGAAGSGNYGFDINNDGSVAANDFIAFRLRFGGSI